jgi:stalled ribosome rescue protein Dom34
MSPEEMKNIVDRAEVQRIVERYRGKFGRTLTVHLSRTINMGNYNSLKVEAGMSQEIAHDANQDQEFKNLWNTVNKEVNRAIAAFDKSKAGAK